MGSSETLDQVVTRLVEHGPTMPHREWSKADILRHCEEMYEDLDAVRSWIIAKLIDQVGKDQAPNTIPIRPQSIWNPRTD